MVSHTMVEGAMMRGVLHYFVVVDYMNNQPVVAYFEFAFEM